MLNHKAEKKSTKLYKIYNYPFLSFFDKKTKKIPCNCQNNHRGFSASKKEITSYQAYHLRHDFPYHKGL